MAKYTTKVERPTVHPELGRLEPGQERDGKNLDKRYPELFRRKRAVAKKAAAPKTKAKALSRK